MNSLQPSAFNLAPPPTLQWQPVRISNFLAICGRAYPVNTTSAAITVTLPLNPNPGDQITLTDYAGTWDANNLTISSNGNKLNGSVVNGTVSTARGSVNLVYIDSTQGWISYASNLATTIVQGIVATGGNEIKTVGSYKYHIFTASGTFTVTAGVGQTFEVMSAGGGGGGGNNMGGGGGAGELDLFTSVTAAASAYTVTVGAKGTGATSTEIRGGAGGTSSFALGGTTYASSLGGGGGGGNGTSSGAGGNGGSGGGGAFTASSTGGTASGSNTFAGGGGGNNSSTIYVAGGGGGATGAGSAASTSGVGAGGNGGAGYTLTNIDSNFTSANFTSFSGMTVICSGGGGGALNTTASTPTRGTGGTGAGSGGVNTSTTNTNTPSAASSFGSGGGGGAWESGVPSNKNGANGYDGVVIVRYLS